LKKNAQSIIPDKQRLAPGLLIAALIALWQLVSVSGLVPAFMLPSPLAVVKALRADISLLGRDLLVTLSEAIIGLVLAIVAAFIIAIIMDSNALLNRAVFPLLLFTQTVPAIAIAPLLVLWMGYGIAPKVALIFLTCFFPVTVGLIGAFAQTDKEAVQLLRSMGASQWQIYAYLKLPGAMPAFFAGLRIAASYSIVGAVIAEWLGGNAGLGVYMTRVRKSYSFDKMFAVILLTAALSLALIKLVVFIQKKSLPWQEED
jgi:ABC-type nitrate/sulfonate/bicarbonate transport system permease component